MDNFSFEFDSLLFATADGSMLSDADTASSQPGLGIPCNELFQGTTLLSDLVQPAASAQTEIALAKPSSDTDQVIAAPSRRSVMQASSVRLTHGKRAMGSQARLEAVQLAVAQDFWIKVVRDVLQTACELHDRPVGQLRAAFHGASGTIRRHRPGWKRWQEYCEDRQLHPGKCTPVDLANFCELLHSNLPEEECDEADDSSSSGPSAVRTTLGALAFVARRAGVPALDAALKDPVVCGYRKQSALQSERKEAPPFSLAFCVHCERLVQDESMTIGWRLFAGALLLMIWASLRYSDASRCCPHSLCIDGWIIRGSCWKTKTLARGRPFGALGAGFLSGWPSWGWSHHFASLLSRWMNSLEEHVARNVDFLIPFFDAAGNVEPRPLPYVSAVLRLRGLMENFGFPESSAFAMHSAKVTLLSFATQLPEQVSDGDRAKQGGHKEATSHSVHLYGRDDVFGPLRLQEAVVRSVRSGWLPVRAQRRGALPPLAEPEAVVSNQPLHDKEFQVAFRKNEDFKPGFPCLSWQGFAKDFPAQASKRIKKDKKTKDKKRKRRRSTSSESAVVSAAPSRARAKPPPPPKLQARDPTPPAREEWLVSKGIFKH